jgi:hypothetical protein
MMTVRDKAAPILRKKEKEQRGTETVENWDLGGKSKPWTGKSQSDR